MIIIKYHDNYYKITKEDIELNEERYSKCSNVEGLNEFETQMAEIKSNGTNLYSGSNVWFYNYLNEIYKITNDNISTLNDNEVVVANTHTDTYIQFTQETEETWLEWAENNSSVDFDLNGYSNFAQLIGERNSQTNKTIWFRYSWGPDRQDSYDYILKDGNISCTTESGIIPHTVYVFR